LFATRAALPARGRLLHSRPPALFGSGVTLPLGFDNTLNDIADRVAAAADLSPLQVGGYLSALRHAGLVRGRSGCPSLADWGCMAAARDPERRRPLRCYWPTQKGCIGAIVRVAGGIVGRRFRSSGKLRRWYDRMPGSPGFKTHIEVPIR
jgi:hypothetical protein